MNNKFENAIENLTLENKIRLKELFPLYGLGVYREPKVEVEQLTYELIDLIAKDFKGIEKLRSKKDLLEIVNLQQKRFNTYLSLLNLLEDLNGKGK